MLLRVEEQAFAKVNLSLQVLGKRPDGYHELDSMVAFADVADHLMLEVADQNSLKVSGPFAGDLPKGDGNIIWKAWEVLGREFALPFVSVLLEKNLPVASGIGGGSADAAAMVRGLLRLAGKSLSELQVANLAKNLGADVPVCFHGKPCQMLGIGETIRPLTIALPPAIVLVNPLVPCSTAEVFKAMALKPGDKFKTPSVEMRNDMTTSAIQVQPIVADVLMALQTMLPNVRMSGSGATCFGLAGSFEEAAKAAATLSCQQPTWWIKPARLL